MRFFALLFITINASLFANIGLAQSDSIVDGLITTPLEKFVSLNYIYDDPSAKISLNTSNSWDIREVPGNIIVYNAQDIISSGARDLMEFLQFAAGLSLGEEQEASVGLIIRGLPVQEGKFIIAYNNVPINEAGTGFFSLAQRVSLANIERIEITMGPGNISYSGNSAFGTINLIPKSANETDGSFVKSEMGLNAEGLLHNGLTMGGNHFIGQDSHFSYLLRNSRGIQTQQDSSVGPYFNYPTSQEIQGFESYLQLTNKKFTVLYYQPEYQPGASASGYKINSSGRFLNISNESVISSSMTIKNSIRNSWQTPWHLVGLPDSANVNSNIDYKTLTAQSILNYNIQRKFFISFLAEGTRIHYEVEGQDTIPRVNKNNMIANDPSVYTGALGLDLILKASSGLYNLSLRSESSTMGSTVLSPRFSYAKIIHAFHVKVMGGLSHRIPEIKNVLMQQSDNPLVNETAYFGQFQTGYSIARKHKLGLSSFFSQIENPIQLTNENDQDFRYQNLSSAQSTGFEFSYDLHLKKLLFNATYSLYHVYHKSTKSLLISDTMDVNQYPFGGSGSNLSFRATWSMSERMNMSVSGIMHGKKDFLYADVTTGQTTWQSSGACSVVNLFFRYQMLRSLRLSTEIGLLNVFDHADPLFRTFGETTSPATLTERQLRFSLKYSLFK